MYKKIYNKIIFLSIIAGLVLCCKKNSYVDMKPPIAEKIKKAGIKKIHYSEMRTFSVLFGIYKRKTLIVYGD